MGKLFSRLFGERLIPTARVDKNGRVVVRHMKLDEIVGAKKKTLIPAPAKSPSEPTGLLRLETAAVIMKLMDLHPTRDQNKYDRMVRGMESLSFDTLQKIRQLTGDAGTEAAYSIYLETAGRSASATISEPFARDVVELSDHVYELDTLSHTYLMSLKFYDRLCPFEAGTPYPKERYDQAVALIDATHAISNVITVDGRKSSALDYSYNLDNNARSQRIADEKLVDLILDGNQFEREQIINIITERGIVDADDIAALINQDGPTSLSSGAL